ncbi:MAG: hypothetical protein OQK82_02990 [Candidatus Pacearchaeota archaeon]|nr:hypothetical protein [Candidatus Pacearchaeota archaeon]
MSGRYFTAPFLCAVIILSRISFKQLKYAGLPILFFMLMMGLINPYSPIHTSAYYDKPAVYNYQISDERDVYYKSTGLLVYGKEHALPQSQFAIDGKKLRKKGKSVIKSASVGIAGYYAGPEVHIIDMYALGDPLLARINIMNRKRWRIGHFPRAIPFNYKQTLESGMMKLTDPDLARFYNKISLLVRGDLFSFKRLYEIWNMNLGKYNYLIDKYCQNPLKIHFRDLKRKKDRGSWMDDDVLMFSEEGLLVDMGSIYHPGRINISVENSDNYLLQLYKKGTLLKEYNIPIRMETNIRGLLNYEIKIDAEVQKNGCDMIKIIPQRGDGFYSMGRLIVD